MKPILFYQGSSLTVEESIAQFVVRQKEFEQVIAEVRRDKMTGSIQHYIFVGQRGSGKSTLLRRIEAEIATDEGLQKRLVAVNLSEEQAGIYRLHDLWERVCIELEAREYEITIPSWEDHDGDNTAYAAALYGALQKALKKAKRKLVLLLDNIDRILETVGRSDNHLLREQLMNHKDLRIIGGSTRMGEFHWKHSEPFYEFFSLIHLGPLTHPELIELLQAWGDRLQESKLMDFVRRHPGRLHAVRILTDGMPRTMLHFVELLLSRDEQQGYEYLRLILDKATPVYQERLLALSPMQQKVVLEMSFFWDSVKVKPLSAKTKIESKTLSALLGQLVEMGVVEKVQGKTKNLMYRLRERFFNLWLIMTQGGPREKRQAKWLTIFLETWYGQEGVKDLYQTILGKMSLRAITGDVASIWTKALSQSRFISKDQRDALLTLFDEMFEKRKEWMEMMPLKAGKIFEDANNLAKKAKFKEALALLETIEQKDFSIELYKGFFQCATGNAVKGRAVIIASASEAELTGQMLAYRYFGALLDTQSMEQMERKAIKAKKGALLYTAFFYHVSEGQNELAIEKLGIAASLGHGDAIAAMAFFAGIAGKGWDEQAFSKASMNVGPIWKAMAYYFQNSNKKEASACLKGLPEELLSNDQIQVVIGVIRIWMGEFPSYLREEGFIRQLVHFPSYGFNGWVPQYLAHSQHNLVWGWFQDVEAGPKLRESSLPLYYATAKLVNSPEAQEIFLAMPPELEEAVNAILESIQQIREKYYPSQKA
jgi:hypothetical protein